MAEPTMDEMASRIAELEAALRPFAAWGECVDRKAPDDLPVSVVGVMIPLGMEYPAVLGDCRRAARLLGWQPGKKGTRKRPPPDPPEPRPG